MVTDMMMAELLLVASTSTEICVATVRIEGHPRGHAAAWRGMEMPEDPMPATQSLPSHGSAPASADNSDKASCFACGTGPSEALR